MFPASQLVQSRGELERSDVSSDSGRVPSRERDERRGEEEGGREKEREGERERGRDTKFFPENPEKVERKVSI